MNDSTNIRTLADLDGGDVSGPPLSEAEAKRARAAAVFAGVLAMLGVAWSLYGGPKGAAYLGVGLVLGAVGAGFVIFKSKAGR